MKASKKVIGSVAVSGLAVALMVTAVTGNQVLSADRTAAAAESQLVKNGMAGFSVVMNEYEFEAADYLDSYVSIEPAETNLVASSAQEAVENTPEESEEKTLSKEEKEWQDKLMAKVDDFLYVREKADADSGIVGKMYKGDRALIKEAGDTWTEIESGSVKGYVKNEYCVMGQDALKYAKKHCKTVAKVSTDGLRIRKSPSTDAEVVKTVASGEKFDVNQKADTKDGWIAIKTDSGTSYVSEEFVTLTLSTGKAVTLEEEAAAKKAEEERKALEQQKAQAAPVQSIAEESKSSGGQTSSEGKSTQNSPVAASADDETLLAALVQCEAGGTSVECMTAVGAVVINRLHSGYAGSIRGVIYQRGQFGPASSGRLEARLASGVSSSARQAARAALGGYDPTGGAKYFKLASSGHNGVVIGPIVFY